jgi:Domain of unknown function (DUF4177)
MKKFQYKTLKVIEEGSLWKGTKPDLEKLEEDLNALGNEGWELVSMIETHNTGTGKKEIVSLLKREKSL